MGEQLAFTTSSVTLGGYSQSALRFGLMDIKPIQVVDTIKQFGVKFRRITRTFESLAPSKSFDDLIYFENEAILGSMDTPDWFKAEELIKIYSQRSIDNYKNDKELQKEIENLRKTERKGRPLLSFAEFMIRRFESEREHYLEMEAHRFLNSNFPLAFYNKLAVLDNTFYDFIKIVKEIVRLHEFRAAYSRDFNMYEKKINEMKKELGPIIDQFDKCSFACTRLKKYINIWNAKGYEEIFYPKFLDINKVDFSVFEKLSNEANMKLRETRGFLLRYDPKCLQTNLDSENPTKKMFGQLVMLPHSSLKLES